MSDLLKIGVIGAGRIGQIHAENLSYRVPGAQLVAISDVVLSSAQKLGERLNVKSISASADDILKNPDIKAVAICSSTDTHASMIVAAAEAGKHIFCEKPISYDLAAIDKALDAVKKAGVKLQIGFNRRFDPNFKAVRDAINEGKIGDVHIVRITSRDPAPPPIEYVKVSGGIFMDMTIHDFDMSRYLAGSEVVEVYAAGGVMVDPEIGKAGDIDTAIITLRFANGALCAIDNSRKAVYGYDQRVEAFGSGGAVGVTNNMPNSAVLSDASGVHGAKPLYFFLERYTESFIAEMRAFVEAVRENKPIPVGGHDGRMATVIGMAAQKSLREGRPVKLSEI